MEILIKALLFIHVIAGFSALVMFWIPCFTQKGGKIHNQVGRYYVKAMWTVLVTAGILSIKNVIVGQYDAAIFLGFLTLLTMNPLWFGIAILKNKKQLSHAARRRYFIQNILLFLFSIFLISYGVSIGIENGVLMLIFGFIGVSNAGLLIKLFKNTYTPRPWIVEHFGGMIVSGIAAHTAFFAFGGRTLIGELLTGYWMVIPWVAPTVIGVIAMQFLQKKYQRNGVDLK